MTASTPGATPMLGLVALELDAKRASVHEGEQNVRSGVRLHETANVDVALGDDAVEACYHALIGLLLIEHLQLGGLRVDIGLRDCDRGRP